MNIMMDSCQNCGNPISAHLEAEYCNKCAEKYWKFNYDLLKGDENAKT